jgi:hypothetical protein
MALGLGADLAAIAGVIVFLVGPPMVAQTFWICRRLGRIAARLDGMSDRLHAEMQAGTGALNDLLWAHRTGPPSG